MNPKSRSGVCNHSQTTESSKLHIWLLVGWIAIGTILRLTQLSCKSPWTDEFSTMVFSLGNSFRPIPLDQAISLDILMQPLQVPPSAGVGAVTTHLLGESNHPPLYFVLAHLWMKLFLPAGSLVSVWVARAFPALLGTAAIPAVYGLGWLAFRSRLVAQLSAAMMAVSPYGIFLAQEARHYTLATLWVIASLSCLVVTVRHIRNQTPLPIWLGLSWIGINSLGIATHYFFTLTLCAEAIVLLRFWIGAWGISKSTDPFSPSSPFPKRPYQHWFRIYAVAAGTLVGGLVWLPVWQNGNSQLTEWIQNDGRVGLAWLEPVFQSLAAWITMISLLPVEASVLPVVIGSGAIMLVFFFWAVPILVHGLKVQLARIGLEPATDSRSATQLFGGFILSAIALFFIFTYCLGIDLTRGARYNFVYFPAVIVLLGASLAAGWRLRRKPAVVLIWLMGFLSAVTVACNLGYQKYYRPDLFVPLLEKVSDSPVLIATTHKTHVQIGEMMGIAWEIKRQHSSINPQFLLAHQEENPSTSTAVLQQTLNQLSRPLDLWLVNFHAPINLTSCVADSQTLSPVDGYEYQLYHCSSKSITPRA